MQLTRGQLRNEGTTGDDIVDTLESLSLKVDLVKNIPVGGTSKRCIVFSSI